MNRVERQQAKDQLVADIKQLILENKEQLAELELLVREILLALASKKGKK